jgi:hypothetical protein
MMSVFEIAAMAIAYIANILREQPFWPGSHGVGVASQGCTWMEKSEVIWATSRLPRHLRENPFLDHFRFDDRPLASRLALCTELDPPCRKLRVVGFLVA